MANNTARVILQPIITSLEQIVIESSNISEPNIMRQLGLDVQSVPCQMAFINLCQKAVEAPVVDTIIAEEASSTKYFLHEIGTKVLIRCLEHTTIDVILQNARSMVDEGFNDSSFLSTASKSLNVAKQHMITRVRNVKDKNEE